MYSITLNGRCAKHHCVIDEERKMLSSSTSGLIFDFSDEEGWSFDCFSPHCVFATGENCHFMTGTDCIFITQNGCTFDTGSFCMIKATYDSMFRVGEKCTLTRGDVFSFYKLPANICTKLPSHGIRGILYNTREYVSKHMNNEEGLIFLIKHGEFFDPFQDDLGVDFAFNPN